MNLTEKYRPKRLIELYGQPAATSALAGYVKAPFPAAFLFAGDTGTGKTSAAHALATELGCAREFEELGGVHEIASGEQTADTVRRMLQTLSYRPFYGSGWKILIINECDRMNPAVETIWLDALESLPAYLCVVFTTNNPESLSQRFRDRCEVVEFESDAIALRDAARKLIADIWQRETGQLHPPQIALDKVVQGGKISFRRLVQAMAPLVRTATQSSAA